MNRVQRSFTCLYRTQRLFLRRNIFTKDINGAPHLLRIEGSQNTHCIIESFAGNVAHSKWLDKPLWQMPEHGYNELICCVQWSLIFFIEKLEKRSRLLHGSSDIEIPFIDTSLQTLNELVNTNRLGKHIGKIDNWLKL